MHLCRVQASVTVQWMSVTPAAVVATSDPELPLSGVASSPVSGVPRAPLGAPTSTVYTVPGVPVSSVHTVPGVAGIPLPDATEPQSCDPYGTVLVSLLYVMLLMLALAGLSIKVIKTLSKELFNISANFKVKLVELASFAKYY